MIEWSVRDVGLWIDVRSRGRETVGCADSENSGEASSGLARQDANIEYRSPKPPFPSELSLANFFLQMS
jgi:hypothetical protein